MITYIRGILEGMEEDKVIVDVGGVGYGIYMAGAPQWAGFRLLEKK